MKLHEFRAGHGMSLATSTPQERQAIHKILEAKGYILHIKAAVRHSTDWDSSFAFQKHEGSLSWMRLSSFSITRNYTYKQMLEILEIDSNVKKHEFKDGDGMNIATSTPSERMAIHRILEIKGYDLYKQTADRDYDEWESPFVFYNCRGSLIWVKVDVDEVDNDHTYKEMLDILNPPEDWQPIPTIELKNIRKDIEFVAKDASCDVYFYDKKPNPDLDMWAGGNYYSAECLDQSLFKDLECLDWKESLHKVIHV